VRAQFSVMEKKYIAEVESLRQYAEASFRRVSEFINDECRPQMTLLKDQCSDLCRRVDSDRLHRKHESHPAASLRDADEGPHRGSAIDWA
jgi:hypothetical protein